LTAGDEIKLYVDGAAVAKMAGVLPVLEGPSRIGADAGAPAVAPAAPPVRRGGKGPAPAPIALGGFKGDLDELQIAKLERSAGYLQAAAISQGTDPGRFIAYGQDEEKGGWDTGYLAILVRSVTLDGWIVIGLLGVMAVVSWIVIATKAAYLSAAEKANERFAECFQHMSDDLVQAIAEEAGHFQAEDKLFRSSPLYRIYQIGAEGIRKRTRTGRALTAEAIEAVRASLDAGLVREHQKLTSRMVLLTIAISGGPFLGLLGTVVGVMITFASIALAGDVNVNAIAPGIAAALVATVAGLAVAIPALFAYNWLLTRVKDVYATMQVFVDEFITKAAESYADGNGSHGVRPRPTIVAAE
jgi:biopolymer transport protein ExbB